MRIKRDRRSNVIIICVYVVIHHMKLHPLQRISVLLIFFRVALHLLQSTTFLSITGIAVVLIVICQLVQDLLWEMYCRGRRDAITMLWMHYIIYTYNTTLNGSWFIRKVIRIACRLIIAASNRSHTYQTIYYYHHRKYRHQMNWWWWWCSALVDIV